MSKIEMLKKNLESFENDWNTFQRKEGDPPIKVTFFEGLKPSGYFVPNIMGYRENPPYTDSPPEVKMAYFNEIFIDGLCVWRRSVVTDDKKIRERDVTDQMIKEIFMSGLSNSWNLIKNDT
jgi:hypothetical protein